MKVICNRGALLEALVNSSAVVGTRSPKVALLCVKLSAADGFLSIAATDLEVASRCYTNQVQIEAPGDLLVAADQFRDIVRECTDDTLSIESDKDTAVIKGQDSTFKLFTQPVADFPNVPEFEGKADYEIQAGQLRTLIKQTLFATARESTRYACAGVLMTAKAKKLTFVSTDTRRLALARCDLSQNNRTEKAEKAEKETIKPIVPTKALSMLDKLLNDPEESVSIQLRGAQVIFHTNSATLTSNLLEGQFPPYEDVLPKDPDKKMTASTADFLSAMRRVALLTSEDSKGARMSFTKKGVVLSSRAPERGEATINFSCKYEGADMEIGFNPFFIVEALKVVDTDDITLEMNAPNRPGVLKGGADFLNVIMPVNLQ
jgi:DNA polymerase-3 subunit beta